MFTGALGVQWRINRAIFLWLGIFVFAGICIGLSVAFNVRIKVEHISQSLLDTNLVRVIRPTASFMAIILGRIFYFAMMFALIFIVCLNRFTVFAVFGIAIYMGFSLVINLYWIIARFGIATGFVLLFVYSVLLLFYTIFVLIAIVFCLRVTSPVRTGGMRGGIQKFDFARHCGIFLAFVAGFALAEYLCFLFFVSKIVYIV